MLYQLSYVRAAAQVSRIPLLLHARAGPAGVLGGGASFGLLSRCLTTTAAVGAATIAASVSKLVVMLRNSSMSGAGRIGAADAECGRSQLEGRRHDSPWAQDVDGRGQARRGRRPTASPGGVARAARGDEYKRRELSGGTDGRLSPAGRRPSGQFSPPPGGRRGPFGFSPGCNATQN